MSYVTRRHVADVVRDDATQTTFVPGANVMPRARDADPMERRDTNGYAFSIHLDVTSAPSLMLSSYLASPFRLIISLSRYCLSGVTR